MSNGAILWPHIGGGGAGPHLDVLRRWQPGGALILDPAGDDVRAFRAAVPGATVIGRIWRDDAEIRGRIVADPEGAAAWADTLVMQSSARGTVDFWQIANEVCQEDPEELRRLVRFERARMALAAKHGYRCGVLGFSVGQIDLPANDRLALWRLTYPVLDVCAADGHIVVTHQYGWERGPQPNLWGPAEKGGAPWLINRIETQVLPRLPTQYDGVLFADGEYGLDGHLVEPGFVGYQGRVPGAEYVRQLTQMAEWLVQYRARMIGHAIFTLGHNPPWGPYDIAGEVAEGLAAHFERQRATVTPPPPLPHKPEPPADAVWDAIKAAFGSAATDLRGKLATNGRYDRRELGAITRIVVHHSTGAPTVSWEGIAAYHVRRGWPGIGYHFGVRSDGTVQYLGDVRDVRYHAGNANGASIGVCFAGDYRTVQPSPASLAAFGKLRGVLEQVLGRSLGLAGHRDVMAGTVCPGDKLHAAAVKADPLRAVLEAAAGANDLTRLNPDAALYKAIGKAGLLPVGAEFRVTVAGQTYAAQVGRKPGGPAQVFYCPEGQWDKVQTLAWGGRHEGS